MKFGLSVCVIFLGASLISGTASAQSQSAVKRALIFSTVAQAADVTSTLAHPHWTRYEANPVLPRNAAGLIAAKGGAALLNVIVSKRLAAKHPRLMFWGQMALGSSLSYITYHNVRSGMRLR